MQATCTEILFEVTLAYHLYSVAVQSLYWLGTQGCLGKQLNKNLYHSQYFYSTLKKNRIDWFGFIASWLILYLFSIICLEFSSYTHDYLCIEFTYNFFKTHISYYKVIRIVPKLTDILKKIFMFSYFYRCLLKKCSEPTRAFWKLQNQAEFHEEIVQYSTSLYNFYTAILSRRAFSSDYFYNKKVST